MIEQIDERLKDWVKDVLGAVTLSLTPPAVSQTGQGVNLYLLELVDTPPPRSTTRPPLQLSLRYLVTTWADQPEDAHRLLGELALAAMESSEFEVEFDPIPATSWTAFGLVPQPSFMLQVPLRRERPEPERKSVQKPLEVRPGPTTSLHGRVLGPGDVPLAGAHVELPSLQRSTRTDTKGRFHFSTVPAEPADQVLRIKAKGCEHIHTVKRPASEDEPLVIFFNPLNGKEQ